MTLYNSQLSPVLYQTDIDISRRRRSPLQACAGIALVEAGADCRGELGEKHELRWLGQVAGEVALLVLLVGIHKRIV